MKLSKKQETVLNRFVRSLAMVAVATCIGFVSGPNLASLLPKQNAALLAVVLVPVLTAAEKALRYGSDPGEAPPENVAPMANAAPPV